jgi:hypothetical protein
MHVRATFNIQYYKLNSYDSFIQRGGNLSTLYKIYGIGPHATYNSGLWRKAVVRHVLFHDIQYR